MPGKASHELSLRQLAAIRPRINKGIGCFCDENVPLTDKLFRDNLPSTLKDIKEMDKIAASLSPGDKRGGTWR